MSYRNIDIMDVDAFPYYDALICDPPWEDRMVRFFETQLKKMTGIEKHNQIDLILDQLGTLSDPQKPLLVFYSLKGTDRVIERLQRKGHTHFATHELLQSNDKPYHLIVFNCEFNILRHVKGFDAIPIIINALKPKVVFDPFAGIGKSAEAVYKAGAKYIGYEINPVRYARLLMVKDKYENL